MERDGFLNVLVPVGPVMAAGELLVFVRDVQRLQVAMERPVLLQQEVVGAAVDQERGDAAVVDPFDDGERVLGSSLGRLAEDPLELGVQFLDLLWGRAERRRPPSAS